MLRGNHLPTFHLNRRFRCVCTEAALQRRFISQGSKVSAGVFFSIRPKGPFSALQVSSVQLSLLGTCKVGNTNLITALQDDMDVVGHLVSKTISMHCAIFGMEKDEIPHEALLDGSCGNHHQANVPKGGSASVSCIMQAKAKGKRKPMVSGQSRTRKESRFFCPRLGRVQATRSNPILLVGTLAPVYRGLASV